jgi:hypothetical protein
MKKLILLIIAVLVVPTFASVPFEADRGLVEITVTLNNFAEGRFGIDTGADQLYVDRDFAIANNLVESTGPSRTRVAGLDGTTGARSLKLRSIEFGGERLLNVDAMVIDINALTHGHDGDHPDGLIGYEILERTYLTIDFPNRELEARFDRPDIVKSATARHVPFQLKNHLIIVDVTFPDGIIRPMMLDYGSSATWISPQVARTLDLDTDTLGDFQQVESLSVGGVITTEPVLVGVRNFAAYRRVLGGLKFDGIIGASFLYCHKITISYRQNQIFVEP